MRGREGGEGGRRKGRRQGKGEGGEGGGQAITASSALCMLGGGAWERDMCDLHNSDTKT